MKIPATTTAKYVCPVSTEISASIHGWLWTSDKLIGYSSGTLVTVENN